MGLSHLGTGVPGNARLRCPHPGHRQRLESRTPKLSPRPVTCPQPCERHTHGGGKTHFLPRGWGARCLASPWGLVASLLSNGDKEQSFGGRPGPRGLCHGGRRRVRSSGRGHKSPSPRPDSKTSGLSLWLGVTRNFPTKPPALPASLEEPRHAGPLGPHPCQTHAGGACCVPLASLHLATWTFDIPHWPLGTLLPATARTPGQCQGVGGSFLSYSRGGSTPRPSAPSSGG